MRNNYNIITHQNKFNYMKFSTKNKNNKDFVFFNNFIDKINKKQTNVYTSTPR